MTAVHIYQGGKLIFTIPNATICPRVGEFVEYKMASYAVVSVTHQSDTDSVSIRLEED